MDGKMNIQEWADYLTRKCFDHGEFITPQDIKQIQQEALESFKNSSYSTTNVIRAERINQAMRNNVII